MEFIAFLYVIIVQTSINWGPPVYKGVLKLGVYK